MTDVQALRELLERAVELEGEVENKAAAGLLESPAADELRTQVAELQDQLHTLTAVGVDDEVDLVGLDGWLDE